VLPSRGESRRLSGRPALISHGSATGQRTEVEALPSPKSGWGDREAVDAVGVVAETPLQTRGERHPYAADMRAAIVLRRGSPFAYSSAETPNATAKPRVVARPTSLPPRRYASGTIVSASMVRIAPPAKERTKATAFGEAPSKSP
jgi:hypothetical protein